MAELTVRSVELVNKVLRMNDSQYPDIPIVQMNIDCGVAIGDSDTLAFPDRSEFPSPIGMLTLCEFGGFDSVLSALFPDQLPSSGDVFAQDGDIKIKCYKLTYGSGLSAGSSYRPVLYNSRGVNTYYIHSNGVRGDNIYQCVGPAFVYYDVVGKRYIGLQAAPYCTAYSSESVIVNQFGIIQTAEQPKYVAGSESYSWSVFPPSSSYLIVDAEIEAFLASHIFNYEGYDPYAAGGNTTPEIGPTSGDWTLPDDELALPGTSYSDLSAGLYRIYAMTPTQVNAFATQLWNTDVMDIISRFFEKPTDVVLGMYSYPFDVQSGNAEAVYFNWISQWSTVDVTGHPVTQEIQHLEFGYIDVPRYSGTFYDFQPYSVIQIHLPYIGFVEVKANEVVGKRVYLDYYVSLFSGDFTASLTVTGDNSPGLIGLYQGNIGRPVPLTQQDLFTLFKKGAELALTAAIAVGSGGVALAAGAEAAEAKVDMERRIEAGLPVSATMAASRYAAEQKTHDEALNVLKKTSIVGAANAMFGNPSGVAIIRNGAVDASSGRTSSQEAYILMTIPHQNVSSEQKLLGYPTNLPGPLSGYTGFTTVRDIRLDVPDATDSEKAEIESIVRSGIII